MKSIYLFNRFSSFCDYKISNPILKFTMFNFSSHVTLQDINMKCVTKFYHEKFN